MSWITGVGLTRFGRIEGRGTLDLMSEAAAAALADAGLQRSQISGLVTGYSTTLPHIMLSTVFAEHFGLSPQYAHGIQLGGATGFALVMLAHELVQAGAARHVLVAAGENRLTGQSRDAAIQTLAQVGHPRYEVPLGPIIPAYYGLVASRYTYETGTTPERLAKLAVLMRRQVGLHPGAQFRDPVTVADVLTSRPIADPLRMLDCCAVADGGAAVIVSRERTGAAGVRIIGCGQAHTFQHVSAAPSLTQFGAAESARRAGLSERISIADLRYAAIYDSFTITLAVLLEELGLAPRGEAGMLARDGHFGVNGRLPLNTHGGLLSYGHCGVGGAMAHLVEAYLQMTIAVAGDPDLRVLLLYLEGLADPHHLAKAARVAHERGLPIVALKSGRTAAGQAAAQSHTGALANEDRVVDAFMRQHGIRRVRDVEEMVDAVDLYLKGWKPTGRRLVMISNSGAACAMAADAASEVGMPMAKLSEETQAGLRAVLHTFAATANPVDITAALLTNSSLFSQILPVIARDPAVDACLISIPVAGAAYDIARFASDSAAFARTTRKPMAIVATQRIVAAPFKTAGLPVYTYETRAITALDGFIRHHEVMDRARQHPHEAATAAVATGKGRLLNEAESLACLAAAAVPVVPHRLCHTADETAAALKALGGLVVVKGCSGDVSHKSELNLVRLGLTDEASVRNAFDECRAILDKNRYRFDGVLVAAMASGRREMVIGAHRDPIFGPVVMLGDGGKYIEAIPDTALLLPPFDADYVRDALKKLRIAPVLDGVRGEQPMDTDAFAKAAIAVGNLMLAAPDILTLDINPMLVGSAGEGCIAIDGVIVRAEHA